MAIPEALAGTNGPIVIRFRFEQRTKSNGFVDFMPDGVLASGQVELDNDQAIPRTCDLVLRAAELPSGFDPLRSLIAVFCEVLDEGTFVRFPIGLFRLTNPTDDITPSPEDTIAFRGSDVTYFLQKDKQDGPFELAAGTNYIKAVESILTTLGLVHDLPPAAPTTPIAFVWEQGTPSLIIVNQLLKGIDHFQIAPDGEGTFRTAPRVAPRGVAPDVSYTTEEEPRFIVPPFGEKQTEATIPNIVLASIQDPNRAVAFGSAENADPDSLLSTFRTETTYAEITMDRAANVATLLSIAEYELLLASGVSDNAILRTVLDPRRMSNEVYRLTVEDDEVGTKWRVRGWTLPLRTGVAMRHNVQRAADFIVTASS